MRLCGNLWAGYSFSSPSDSLDFVLNSWKLQTSHTQFGGLLCCAYMLLLFMYMIAIFKEWKVWLMNNLCWQCVHFFCVYDHRVQMTSRDLWFLLLASATTLVLRRGKNIDSLSPIILTIPACCQRDQIPFSTISPGIYLLSVRLWVYFFNELTLTYVRSLSMFCCF